MLPFFPDLSKITAEIKETLEGRKLALFLDYDGTLAEIHPDPDDNYMSDEMRNVLQAISCLENVLTVAISGRQINNLQERIGIENFVYSGNHGLELCLNGKGTEITYNLDEEEIKQLRKQVQVLVKELEEKKLGKDVGGIIENKDTTAAWHYLGVESTQRKEIVQKAKDIINSHSLTLFEGVGCVEIRHPAITKSDGIKKILYHKLGVNWHETHSVIFIGDSTGDENAYLDLCRDHDFKSEHMIFVRVLNDVRNRSEGSLFLTLTMGQYLLRDIRDVYNLLKALKEFYSK